MFNKDLAEALNKQFQTGLLPNISQEELLEKLSELINHLIQTDFEKLVFILYKADISETKLKDLLQRNSQQDAAPVIAKLIIEREQEKIYSRKQFSNRENIPDEEKW
ncbi:MAG: hypothetical protein ABIN97_13310 [Ginsengibacter sp.]